MNELRIKLGHAISMSQPLKHLEIVAKMYHEDRHTYPDLRFKSGRRGPEFKDCYSYVCRKSREAIAELANND